VLPAAARLRRRAEFTGVVRRGRRAGRPRVVAHLLVEPDPHPPRVGVVVTRAVGTAVTRNRVRRRLRHLMASRLARLPAGALLVVRACPPAAAASYDDLAADLDAALRRLGVGRPGAGVPVSVPAGARR
jgi:ribonuclease P protein component